MKFFITGSDTDVGKSFVTASLLRAFLEQGVKAVALKPVQTGYAENSRIPDENSRIPNENSKIPSENSRISSENSRIPNENSRISSENSQNQVLDKLNSDPLNNKIDEQKAGKNV